MRSGLSYLWASMKPKGKEENLEQWVSNRFGKRLYQHFFKTYTEKVWGVPTTELRAEWAAQRIKGLSFFSAAKAAFFGNKGNKIKSLINEFHYPRFGPGQMWETMADEIIAAGGEVRLNTPVTELEVRDGRIVAIVAGGERIEPGHVISSLPLRATVGMAGAAAPGEVQAAAQGLRYRDFLTVALIIDGEDLFPDNWIYIHDPDVRVGRIQNFRSWSPWMVPDQSKASVGLEYFCFQGDDLWDMDDDGLVELAKRELGAARPRRSVEGREGLRDARAQGLSDVRRGLRRARGVDPRLARRHRQPDPGRPQRPAPLQQLRPLDADGDARGGEHHAWAPTTTSGRSTPSPSTTRRPWPTSTRTSARPETRGDARAARRRSSFLSHGTDRWTHVRWPAGRPDASLSIVWRAYGFRARGPAHGGGAEGFAETAGWREATRPFPLTGARVAASYGRRCSARSKRRREQMSELEEGDPPEKLEDWPDGKAKYLTYGGPEGTEGYDEGRPASSARPRWSTTRTARSRSRARRSTTPRSTRASGCPTRPNDDELVYRARCPRPVPDGRRTRLGRLGSGRAAHPAHGVRPTERTLPLGVENDPADR